MTGGLRTVLWLVLASLLQVPAGQAPGAAAGEDDLRAAIQQYYDAQGARDPDKAASFWSANANPRMTRDTFVALFGPRGEDAYTVEIRSVAIAGDEAKVRVMAVRTHVETLDPRPIISRTSFANAQTWHREAGVWKLLRDGLFADELADQYLAAAPADRPAFVEAQSPVDRNALRYTIAQRASMAITLPPHDYTRGKALFEHALEIAHISGDRRSEANALHNIAQADYFLRDFPGATGHYEQELAIGREIDDADVSAGALFGLGTVAYSRAEYTPALGFYRDALALYEKRDDTGAIGRTAVSIGNVQYLQAEYDAASASYRRGLTLALGLNDRPGATFARRGLGRVLAAQGDLPAALDMYTQVLADTRADLVADARLRSSVGTALESVGEVYFRLGNTEQARTAFTEAQAFETDAAGLGRVLLSLGTTELVAGRFDAALAAYSDARVRFASAKNDEGVAHAWVGVGFSQTAREKFDDAIVAYKTAIAVFEKANNGDGAARAWLGLSRAQSGAADDSAALESAVKVATMADRLKSDDLAWRAGERRGEALRKLKRLDEARTAFEGAAAAIERLAADAPVNAEARNDLSDSASVWTGMAFTLAAQGDAMAALRALEARRAHIRRVDFAAFQHDIAPGATADELAEEQAIVRDTISTRAQLRAETQGKPDPARVDRLRQQLETLAAKRAAQQARLYARLPELAKWRGVAPSPVEPSALTDFVPGAKGLVVEYLVADDELLIVTIARGDNGPDVTAKAVPLNRRAFADVLAAAMQKAALESADEWHRRAGPLAAALFEPIAARLAGRDRLLIVPDDLLWKVPFEALPRAEGEPEPFVTYATSLATLAVQRSLAPATSPRVPAFLAAPAIPDAIRAQLTLTLPSWKPQDTEAALNAARLAAAAYGENTAVQSGAEATETALRASLGTSDVIHVQAPLQVSGATPLLSSILLSSTGDLSAADGRVEARELFGAAGGRTRTLVLADGSTFGAAGVGNAMDPIAWAASAAGVSTLLLGRWPSDAYATDALAAAFHARLATGASEVDAWHAAVTAARDKAAAPAAWTGLRLIGGGG